MSRTVVQIKSADLLLEGLLVSPDGVAPENVVVVCHPHPQRGGDMHNNVVSAIVQAVSERGFAALSFNFRGVGASQGQYDNGIGEQEDVRAALVFAAALPAIERVGLAGYSFGAGVAASTVDDSVAALALVSAPSARLESNSKLTAFAGPVLLVSGDADHVSSIEALQAAAAQIGGLAEVVALPGVDHFWWGHEAQLREIVGAFFEKTLKAAT